MPAQQMPMRHHHDETYAPVGAGAHPDLGAHDALGLATQAELDAHAATTHGGGHTIEDEGVALTQRTTINFVGAGVTAADSGGKTVVTIPGGGGSGGGEPGRSWLGF